MGKVIHVNFINNKEVLNEKLKSEGFSFVGNIDKYNQKVLESIINYMDENNVDFYVGQSYDIFGNILVDYKSLWINLESFNHSNITKRFIFKKKNIDNVHKAYDFMMKKLNLKHVLMSEHREG